MSAPLASRLPGWCGICAEIVFPVLRVRLSGVFPSPLLSSTLVSMRIIMMGTGPFAVPTFRALYETRHEIVALATGPLRTHRGKPVEPISSIRDVAQEHSTPVFDPEDVNTPDSQARLAAYNADLLVVCDYGQILSPATLGHGPAGWRQSARLAPAEVSRRGADQLGNLQRRNGNRRDVHPHLAANRRRPLHRSNPSGHRPRRNGGRTRGSPGRHRRPAGVRNDRPAGVRPSEADSARRLVGQQAPRLKKTDGEIDWSRPAAAIKNQIRAMEPWPKTYTFWHRAGRPAGPADSRPGIGG